MPCVQSGNAVGLSCRPVRRNRLGVGAVIGLCALTLPDRRVYASFHFMQIEQVIAGVDGDASAQAVQLRMRSNGQEQVDKGRLIAWDARGENPVVLIDFAQAVAIGTAGSRVLIASERFSSYTLPAAQPDFVLENLPPDRLPSRRQFDLREQRRHARCLEAQLGRVGVHRVHQRSAHQPC
ncbi:MAG: hypothetical protein HY763_05435 [Planctomycetes bacterium]|nr:hypothetical protein [Planctomycetota bacterium]